MTDSKQITAHTVDASGAMMPLRAESLVLTFPSGKTLEVVWGDAHPNSPLPPSIEIWGGRRVQQDISGPEWEAFRQGISTVAILPSAGNWAMLYPYSPADSAMLERAGQASNRAIADSEHITAHIADASGELAPLAAASLVLTFPNGKTLEVEWSDLHPDALRPPSIQVWGGRRPLECGGGGGRQRVSRIVIVPEASNLVLLYPYLPAERDE